jgi:hypothetical protein
MTGEGRETSPEEPPRRRDSPNPTDKEHRSGGFSLLAEIRLRRGNYALLPASWLGAITSIEWTKDGLDGWTHEMSIEAVIECAGVDLRRAVYGFNGLVYVIVGVRVADNEGWSENSIPNQLLHEEGAKALRG